MQARLSALAGPLKGSVFPLEEETYIGRGSNVQIRIADSSISRKHCLIKEEGDSFYIADLKSRNGTFVNGIPVHQRILEHGSQIEVGESLFIYLQDEPVAATSFRVIDNSTDASTTELPKDQKTIPVNADLGSLTSFVNQLNSITNATSFSEKLLTFLTGVVAADRGVLLIQENENLSPLFHVAKGKRKIATASFDKATVAKVLNDNTPRLDATKGTWKICVPLRISSDGRAFVYLESREVSFSENELQVVTNICNLSEPVLTRLWQMKDLQSKNLYLTAELSAKQNLVGQSKEMQSVYEMIHKVAPTDATVLITGESGTGKEMIARAIHRNSRRSLNPFIAINCAAIPEALLESELFGHEKGAFTGATGMKKGRFEMASSGTLFLDEITELATPLQAKLLRVLQERELDRLGSHRPVPIDVRVITATNRDLREAMEKGILRSDLYYRLNVVVIHAPLLRNRKDDIPLLANYFFTQMAGRLNPNVSAISAETMACLVNYHWPGNVRELQNAIERALILASGTSIEPLDLPFGSVQQTDSEPLKRGLQQTVGRAKKEAIIRALKKTGGNFTKAAQLLGLQRTYLHRLVRKMKLDWGRNKS